VEASRWPARGRRARAVKLRTESACLQRTNASSSVLRDLIYYPDGTVVLYEEPIPESAVPTAVVDAVTLISPPPAK